MSTLDIIKYPDPFLRLATEKVLAFDDELAQLISDMRETMISARGIGLAAPQVGKGIKVVVVDNSPEGEPHGSSTLALVNPEIVEFAGHQLFEEGCLSVVDLKANVKRAQSVKVVAQDISGHPLELDFDGFQAVVVQHEVDHLNGILFIDHLSNLKRNIFLKRMTKASKIKENNEQAVDKR
jgi:peptide deformylase